MADEFMKGFAVLTGAGMIWFSIASWYYTPSFDGPQLIGEGPADPGVYGAALMTIGDMMLWFALIGALTFWVLIPAFREGRRALEDRRSNTE